MNRAKEWEEEIIGRFPLIDRIGLPITAEFITILEEMGGFDEGADLHYNLLTRDINIACPKSRCLITPEYVDKQVSNFRCVLPLWVLKIQPTSEAIQVFLRTYWPVLFPQDTEEKGE